MDGYCQHKYKEFSTGFQAKNPFEAIGDLETYSGNGLD
jgi:hypothetical protein